MVGRLLFFWVSANFQVQFVSFREGCFLHPPHPPRIRWWTSSDNLMWPSPLPVARRRPNPNLGTRGMMLKLCKSWEKLPTSTGFLAGCLPWFFGVQNIGICAALPGKLGICCIRSKVEGPAIALWSYAEVVSLYMNVCLVCLLRYSKTMMNRVSSWMIHP